MPSPLHFRVSICSKANRLLSVHNNRKIAWAVPPCGRRRYQSTVRLLENEEEYAFDAPPPRPVPPVYIAATRQHVGKTSTSLALLSGLQKRFNRVGFMKVSAWSSFDRTEPQF